MPVYEYVVGGEVVERVQPVDDPEDFENTRLGVAVLEAQEAAARGELGPAYWRIEGHEITNAVPDESSTQDPAEPADEPDIAAPARPAHKRKE